jgi:hypothetical protein
MKKGLLLFLTIAVLMSYNFVGCKKIVEVYIESDLRPVDGFDQTDIQAVAILNFDASSVRESDVDNIALRDAIAYDIIKNLYEQKKVRVIQGQAVQAVQERETIAGTVGDYEADTSTIERLVTYKYNPYQKVDAVLSGKVVDYEVIDEDRPGYNYIELWIQLVDSVDGTMYWVTKIRGNYKDVIYTIIHSIGNKVYTEPAVQVFGVQSLPGANP